MDAGEFLERYKPFIIKKSKYYFDMYNGHIQDFEDFLQDIYIVIFQGLEKYNPNKSATLLTYVANIIKNKAIDSLIKKKKEKYATYSPLSYSDENYNNPYLDVSEDYNHSKIILEEVIDEVKDSINKNILKLKAKGYNDKEISSLLCLSGASISVRIKKMKKNKVFN